MKKILSLVVFAVALVWTWSLIHSSAGIGSETHSGIQEKLATLIQQTVSKKRPTAQDIQVTRLWTESVDDNKVRAVFAYRFSETVEGGEKLEQTVEGEAVLHREPGPDPRIDNWVLQKVTTTNDNVAFDQGSIVTPVAGADEEAPGAPQPAAPVAPAAPAPEHH